MGKGIASIASRFFLSLALVIAVPSTLNAEETFVTIAGGDFSGVYFPVGLAMSELVNRKRHRHGIRAAVEATSGATFNVAAILAGNMEFGLTQADKQYHALRGLAEWSETGPQHDLRSVFSLYHESVTLVAAVDAGIETVADLRGKRVSIGNPGSSQHRLVGMVLEAAGLDVEKDLKGLRVSASTAPAMLEDNRIDAYFFTVGHPSETIRMALSGSRQAKLVAIEGPSFDRLVANHTYYTKHSVPVRAFYPEFSDKLPATIDTVSVMATLCTSAGIPDRVVYVLTKTVFENLDEFRGLHPALREMSAGEAVKGLSAELHPGARQYFREIGLLK